MRPRRLSFAFSAILGAFVLTACERPLVQPEAVPARTPSFVVIDPQHVVVEPGEEVRFSAEVYDHQSNRLDLPLEWRATGGVVEGGRFLAEVEEGTFQVTVQVTDAIQAQATVEISRALIPSQWILPGDDIQELIDAHPPGTSFLVRAGVHRLQEIQPRTGDVFVGEAGAILSGARVLTSFARSGPLWVAVGQTQESEPHGQCEPGEGASSVETCRFNEELFLDGEPLRRVGSRTLVGPGTWFFDYPRDEIWFGDDPSGHLVEVSEATHAFHGDATGVSITNLTIEKYANPAQSGAVDAGGPGWAVMECEVRLNHGAGIQGTDGARILGNFVHRNGQIGITSNGHSVLVEGNEIAANNTAGFDPAWEAGGTKFVNTSGLVVRANRVHSNGGPGLWTDIDNVDTLYEDNVVFDNAGAGIFHEISYEAVIRDNVVYRNGVATWMFGAGIQIANSEGVQVYGNVVATSEGHAITGTEQDRGDGPRGPYRLARLRVRNNVIAMDPGARTGIDQDTNDTSVFFDREIEFLENTYYIPQGSEPFVFANRNVSAVGWLAYGFDRDGAFRFW